MIGDIEFDDATSVNRLRILEGNTYFGLVQTSEGAYQLKITRRLDVDNGLERVQTMLLECTTHQRLTLEV